MTREELDENCRLKAGLQIIWFSWSILCRNKNWTSEEVFVGPGIGSRGGYMWWKVQHDVFWLPVIEKYVLSELGTSVTKSWKDESCPYIIPIISKLADPDICFDFLVILFHSIKWRTLIFWWGSLSHFRLWWPSKHLFQTHRQGVWGFTWYTQGSTVSWLPRWTFQYIGILGYDSSW